MLKPFDIFKSLAFQFDAETMHHFTLRMCQKAPLFGKALCPYKKSARYQLKGAHLNWSFPIGLAAGLDKNAQALPFFEQLGFGSIEVGTVTPKPQVGNPRPRIFRYPKEKSLRNSMGFPNQGAQALKAKLLCYRGNIALGVNIGKNKSTSAQNAWQDYQKLYQQFAPLCDYVVINISSPNTPGLRDLQKAESLSEIFQSLYEARKTHSTPLFVKIAPDLDSSALRHIIDKTKEYELAGIVATNTTQIPSWGPGGVSGLALKSKARKIRAEVLAQLKETPHIDTIGVGGVDSFDDLLDFWKQGGKLMQAYSALIYRGPTLLKEVAEGIEQILEQTQAQSLQELFDNNYFLK